MYNVSCHLQGQWGSQDSDIVILGVAGWKVWEPLLQAISCRRPIGKLNHVYVHYIILWCILHHVVGYCFVLFWLPRSLSGHQLGRRASVAHIQPYWLLRTSVSIHNKFLPRGQFLLETCQYAEPNCALFHGVLKAKICNFTAKRNSIMHLNMSHKTAILVKCGCILQRKCPLVFPLMFYNCNLNSVIHRGSWKQHVGCMQTEAAAAAASSCCGQLR